MQDTFARATHSAKRALDDRVSCIQAYYIVVLFIKIEIYKLNQGPQAVGYVCFTENSSSAVESAFCEKLRRIVVVR